MNRFIVEVTLVYLGSLLVGPALAQTAPTILQHPQSVIVPYGATASFSVTADGTAPFSYRWRSNGITMLITPTNRYWVSNASQIARYDVVVSNPSGQKLSRPAALSFFNYERTQGSLDLTLTGMSVPAYGSNYVYEIQYKTDLGDTNWLVWTNLVLPQATVTFQTLSFTNAPQGFFRAVLRTE